VWTFQVFGVILGVIGAIVDGAVNTLVSALDACISDSGAYSGNSDYFSLASSACDDQTESCGCVYSGDTTCSYFDGGIAAKSCDNIFNEYKSNLHAATAFDIMSLLAVFCLCVVTCGSVCCKCFSPSGASFAAAAQPAVPPQQPVFVGAPVVYTTSQPQGYPGYPPGQHQGYPLPQQGYPQMHQSAPTGNLQGAPGTAYINAPQMQYEHQAHAPPAQAVPISGDGVNTKY
jgi:hypothetical protein